MCKQAEQKTVKAVWSQVDNIRVMYIDATSAEEREFLKKLMIELLELLPGV